MFVGIDVSKQWLDVHICPQGRSFRVDRDVKGLSVLIETLGDGPVAAVAVEATGGFETIVAATLGAAGLPVVVINPAQVRHYAQAIGRRAKTDPIDAEVIARFAEAVKPQVRPLPEAAAQVLGELIARRRQIIEMLVAERQRLRRLTVKGLVESARRVITVLEQERTALDQEIAGTVRNTPVWREREDLLASVPGIGPTIARAHRRTARIGQPRSQAYCRSRRPRAVHQNLRTMEGQELHPGRTRSCPIGALHG